MDKKDFSRCVRFAVGLLAVVSFAIVLVHSCRARAIEFSAPEGAVAYLLAEDVTPKKDPRWGLAEEIERILIDAAELEGLDPALLVAMAYRESGFRTGVTGKLGEVGLIQVHGVAARRCNLQTAEGQAMCGARWLARMISECGGYVVLDSRRCQNTLSHAACGGGLAAYASGSCKVRTKRTAWVIRSRLQLAEKIRPLLLGTKKREAILASGGF